MSGAWAAGGVPVVRSMSRKGAADNARAEGFFGTLKCDFFEGRDWEWRALRGVPGGGWTPHRVVRDGEDQEVARLEDDGGVQEGHGLRRHGRGLGPEKRPRSRERGMCGSATVLARVRRDEKIPASSETGIRIISSAR